MGITKDSQQEEDEKDRELRSAGKPDRDKQVWDYGYQGPGNFAKAAAHFSAGANKNRG